MTPTPRFVKPELAGELRTGNGTLLCVWCGSPLSGRQQRWCGEDCVALYKAEFDWQLIRAGVAERDNGICAMCGIDTFALKDELRAKWTDWEYRTTRFKELEAQGWKRLDYLIMCRNDLWDCDHIVPIVDGGHRTDPANLRTLCIPCHAKVTAESARERAKRRRAEKAS